MCPHYRGRRIHGAPWRDLTVVEVRQIRWLRCPKNPFSSPLLCPHFRFFPAHPINLFLGDLRYGVKQLGLGQELCRRVGFCQWRGGGCGSGGSGSGGGGGGGEGGGGALAALAALGLSPLSPPPFSLPLPQPPQLSIFSSLGLCVHLGKPHRSRACCFQRPGFESVEPPRLSSAMARRGCFQAPIRE